MDIWAHRHGWDADLGHLCVVVPKAREDHRRFADVEERTSKEELDKALSIVNPR